MAAASSSSFSSSSSSSSFSFVQGIGALATGPDSDGTAFARASTSPRGPGITSSATFSGLASPHRVDDCYADSNQRGSFLHLKYKLVHPQSGKHVETQSVFEVIDLFRKRILNELIKGIKLFTDEEKALFARRMHIMYALMGRVSFNEFKYCAIEVGLASEAAKKHFLQIVPPDYTYKFVRNNCSVTRSEILRTADIRIFTNDAHRQEMMMARSFIVPSRHLTNEQLACLVFKVNRLTYNLREILLTELHRDWGSLSPEEQTFATIEKMVEQVAQLVQAPHPCKSRKLSAN